LDVHQPTWISDSKGSASLAVQIGKPSNHDDKVGSTLTEYKMVETLLNRCFTSQEKIFLKNPIAYSDQNPAWTLDLTPNM
jgi:hypothetical protein